MARRLAAIMFTDLAGYTALTQTDEPGALRLLQEQERLVGPILELHRGRKVKAIGDGLLIEFPNVLDAVECAVDLQRHVRERNIRELAPALHVRVGIHLGDVQEAGTDILGDAVNIASRIEPLAETGGVCLSGQVFDQVHNKVTFRFEPLGPRTLKGIREPIDVYRLILPWVVEAAPSRGPLAGRLAVLPLRNISPDPRDEYFADGLTEELISTLSKVGDLSVISRTSVMQYSNHAKSIADIARELNSSTIIEGSVRKVGDRVRVTIQVIDATQDKHLWSESYDRELQDIFAIQADIADHVTRALKVRLLPSETKGIASRSTENVEAYQLYLKGLYHLHRDSREENAQALRCFQDAIGLDPKCAIAYAGVCDCYHMGSHANWLRPEEAYPPMKSFATQALEIDPGLAEAHFALGTIHFHYEWKWQEAERELRRAIELKPSSGDVYGVLAYLVNILGRREEAWELLRRGTELSPQFVSVWAAGVGPLGMLLIPERLDEIIARLERLAESNPGLPSVHQGLAFLYYRASRTEQALLEMRKAEALSNGDPELRALVALLLAFLGQKEESSSILSQLAELARSAYVSQVRLACILFALGRPTEAFDRLDEAYRRRAIDLVDIRSALGMEELRADPRWKAIETAMGLPPLSADFDRAPIRVTPSSVLYDGK